MRAIRLALLPAGVGLGLLAEWSVLHRAPLQTAVTGQELRLAVADFVVGIALIGCGVVCWSRRSQSRIGLLLCAAGFTWLLGTFADSTIDSLASFGSVFVTLHRGPLIHAVLSYPDGRLRRRIERLVVAISYAIAAVTDVGQNAEATIVLAAVFALVAMNAYLRAAGPQKRARAPALAVALAFAAVLCAGSVASLASAGAAVDRGVLWAYQAVIFGIAVGFTLDLLRGRWTEATVTGLVVDLGEIPGEGILRGRLAAALGDPGLALGYWIHEEDGYFDETGRRLELPEAGSGREVTIVLDGSEPVAALVHDAGVVEDRELVDSVAAAARIAVANVRLQREIGQQIEEIEASRRRIVEAGDLQRRRLERELRDGAERRLDHIRGVLGGVDGEDAPPMLTEALAELERARVELRQFAQGIHPRVLTEGGLSAALEELAARSPIEIELNTSNERAPAAVEAAAYFVCSEALANVGKYANASRATIDVSRDDNLLLVAVRDDGVGGASLDKGSGLRGLADRVEALGGRLSVESPPGEGTLLVAELPLAVA